jgi:glyoxylase-like metal-dependent hydrolase (beta-lactamase superfamily II)
MLPNHLNGHEAKGLEPKEPVAQFEIGDYHNFIYLILDWNQKKAAIVDPQSDLEEPLTALQDHNFELTAVFLTHTHFDHIAGVPRLVERFKDIPIYVHPTDARRLDKPLLKSVHSIANHQTVQVGSIEVQVFHTPGHSAGECSYYFERGHRYLFTGDTLFIRDCGRTDFEDGSNEQMYASLQIIKALPSDTIILPGHHYVKECASVLSKELLESAPLRCRSIQELAALP